jgi:hypothetical protein
VQAVLSSGAAVALLPDDPRSPFRCWGRWYGGSDGMQDQLWRPVDLIFVCRETRPAP